ncbi:GL14854 [Drosophila persimilis]|uniref:GL14854 n=1 Tax=Drosophila persimilis TaxID=7234 RepID=B4H0H4_DROPE|nr:GL14854 [Drosophila persimilis]
MPVKKQEAHRALELLEDYHARLSEPQDRALRIAIERVIRIFKSRLFQALLDIQEFYELTLLDDSKSIQQKTAETLQIATKWEKDGQAVKIADNQRMRIESDTENAKDLPAENQQQVRSSRSPQQQQQQLPQSQSTTSARSGSQTTQIQIQTYHNPQCIIHMHSLHQHQRTNNININTNTNTKRSHSSDSALLQQQQQQRPYRHKMLKRAFEST